MRLTIATPDEVEEIREIDALEFPGAAFPEDSTFWVLDRDPEAGYCGAVVGPARRAGGDWHGGQAVHLTRGYVDPDLRGRGLQRRMVRTRLAWGRREGASLAQTYTWHENIASMRTLARCGFVPLRASDGFIRWERNIK